MPPRRSANARQRQPRARGPRPAVEDVPVGALERLERREAGAREERHRATDAPPTEPPPELLPAPEQAASPIGLELEQCPQLGARPVELGDAEARAVVHRQVDAPRA